MLEPFGAVLVRVIDQCAELYLSPREEQGPPTLEEAHYVMHRNSFTYGPTNPFHYFVPCTNWSGDWEDLDDFDYSDC